MSNYSSFKKQQLLVEGWRKFTTNDNQKYIDYHIQNNIPFSKSVLRAGSDKYFEVISEARRLYNLNKLTNLHEDDIEMFEETHLGEWGIFEGQKVPLDFPMLNEEVLTEEEKKKHPLNKPMKNTGGGKKWKVYVRSKSGGIKKVTYGDAKGGLKGNWNNPEAKKSFAARHDCKNKKDKTTSGYWACRANKDWGGQTSGYW